MLKFRWETSFKETGVGEIPIEWEIKKLQDLATLVKGVSYKSSEINPNGNGALFITLNNFLRGGGFKNEEYKYYVGRKSKEKQVVKNGDLIIALTDVTSNAKVVGAPAIVNLPEGYDFGIISLDCAKMVPKIEFSRYYIYSYLKVSQEENATFANGVNVLHLNVDLFIRQKSVPYPPPPEQYCIASVLSWFDGLIENKKRQNEILEKTAMAIFKNWFIDFEPFKDEQFEPSELGEIPKEWGVQRLGSLCEIIMGQSPPSKYYNERGEGLPFVQGKGQFGRYVPNTNTYCSKIVKLAKPKDVLVTVRAPIGELNISDKEYIIGRGLAALRSPHWIFLYLYLLINNELLRAQERGTTFDAITKQELETFPVLIPPQPILEKFHSLTEPLFQKIVTNHKQITILGKVRNALLPLLVFGRLRVEEI